MNAGADDDGDDWMEDKDDILEGIDPDATFLPEDVAPAPPPLMANRPSPVPKLKLPTFPVTALGTSRKPEPERDPNIGDYTYREQQLFNEIDYGAMTIRTHCRAPPTPAERLAAQRSTQGTAHKTARRTERENRRQAMESKKKLDSSGTSIYGSAVEELQGGAWTSRNPVSDSTFKPGRSKVWSPELDRIHRDLTT